MQSMENCPRRLDTMESLTEDCQDWLERCLTNDQKSECNDVTSDIDSSYLGNESPEERKGTYARLRSASRPHSTPLTLKWLEENYEIAEGVCIPRSTLYVHYLDYCEKHDTQPVNAASFGKIIRQQFPQLTTRRLGTRGQSKYHYYGIGVRETSKYYEVAFSAKGVQSSSDGKKDNAKQIIAYSPRSKLGTLLPDFPDIKDIKLPANVSEEKVLTFLMMYRTHCQRILDTVIRANFDEVQSFLLHFWQGMPTHIKSILESKTLVTLVGVCDSILYKAIANVLMPTVLQPLPESLTQVIRNFSIQLDDWLRQALDALPECLQRVKFDLARRFSQVLKRQTSLNHLCQAARTVINSTEITSQMLEDWYSVDLNSIIKQTLYTTESNSDMDNVVIVKLARDFEILLEEQAPLESYIEWLDGMIEQCVSKKCQHQSNITRRVARQFLLMWSCVGTRVIRDMTLHSAPSFGSFHLLHLMFDEYVLYMVENIHNQDKADDLLRAVKGEISLEFLDELTLTPPHSCKSNVLACTGSDFSDSQRSSVIRVPESSYHPGDLTDGTLYCSQNEALFFQQPSIYTGQRLFCSSGQALNQSQPVGPSYPPACRHRNNTESTSLYGIYPSQLPEVVSSSYDWATAGQMAPPTLTNMAMNKTFTDQNSSLKAGNVMQLQSESHMSASPYYGPFCNDNDTGFKGCTNVSQVFNRKCSDDALNGTTKTNMADMYYHNVQSFLLHFWQGMPTHIKSILESKTLVTLVGVCDSILYKAIANVLMPTVLQPLPESLTQVIRNFSIQLDDWLRQALDALPECLQRVKFDLARRFSQVLKRQTSLNHLCQAARTVINSTEITSQMLEDWYSVDLNSIIKQTLYTTESNSDMDNVVIVKLARDFEILLEEQAPLESYIEWLDGMIEQCVSKKCQHQSNITRRVARQFLLMWSCVGTRVIRDMTLHSAPSFGSFHLLHLMFDEYVLYMVENIHNQDKADDLLRAVKGEISLEFLDELTLTPPHSCKSNVLACTGSDFSDSQRSSVIRVPESSYHPGDLTDGTLYCSQNEALFFQQPSIYTGQRLFCSSGQALNQSQPVGPSYPPACRHRNNTESTSLYGIYPSQLPEVVSSSYDWATAGQMAPPTLTNMAMNKTFTDQNSSLKAGNVMQLQSESHMSASPYYGPFCNDNDTGFKGCTNVSQVFNRKCSDDALNGTTKTNMADMYYHNVANLI